MTLPFILVIDSSTGPENMKKKVPNNSQDIMSVEK